MKVIFLAAGKGERMQPYSAIMEKSMLPLGGKPIIRLTIEAMLKSEIVKPEDIIISVLPENRDILLHEFRDIPVNVRTVSESINTGNHYQIASSRAEIADNEDVMIHYADNISAIDYKRFYNEYKAAVEFTDDVFCCIAGTKLIKHDYSAIKYTSKMAQFLQQQLHNDTRKIYDKVTGFIEKPFLGERGWMGMAIFKNGRMEEALTSVMRKKLEEKNTASIDFGFDILPQIAEQGHVILYKHEGEWFDVGNAVSYMKLRKRIAAGEKIV